MAQAKTINVSWKSVLRSAAFRRGIEDVRKGLGFADNYDRLSSQEQWDYERGRQFACVAPSNLRIKHDRTVNPLAIRFYANARRNKIIL